MAQKCAIAKLDSDLNEIWSKEITSTTSFFAIDHSETYANGDLLISGRIVLNSLQSAFLSRISSEGIVIWI